MGDKIPLPRSPPGPVQAHAFLAFLFDLDGTLIDSSTAIGSHWKRIELDTGVPAEKLITASHGRRCIDVLSSLSPQHANWDYVCEAELRMPREFGSKVSELSGARQLMEYLNRVEAHWGIVTSSSRPLARAWLDLLGLSAPRFLVTAEDVAVGKPDPRCYELGVQQYNLENRAHLALVLEDAPAGVKAAKAAGCKVLAVATTHTADVLQKAGADWIVPDLRSVKVANFDPITKEATVEFEDILLK